MNGGPAARDVLPQHAPASRLFGRRGRTTAPPPSPPVEPVPRQRPAAPNAPLQDALTRLAALEAERALWTGRREAAEAAAADAQRAVDEAQEELRHWRAATDVARTEATAARNDRDAVLQERDEARWQARVAVDARDAALAAAALAQQDRAAQVAEHEALRDRVGRAESRTSQAQAELQALAHQNAGLSAEVATAWAERDGLTGRLAGASTRIAVLEGVLVERDERITGLLGRIADLEEALEDLRWQHELCGASPAEPGDRSRPIEEGRPGSGWVPDSDSTTGLYTWQTEALASWTRAGCHGVIEAVTGAGKTRVGIAAARMAAASGRKTLVIAPTIELLHQWRRSFAEVAPELRVGVRGGRDKDDLYDHDVLVSTIQGAAAHPPLPASGGLLLADEVHTLGASRYSLALDEDADWRLGLTATYDRGDDGNEDYLDPYFGGVRYRLWYDRALADRVIAPFTVSLVGVRLAQEERRAYAEVDELVRRTMRELVDHWDLPAQPYSEFLREVTRLAKYGTGRASEVARAYELHFTKRRKILAESNVKLHVLGELASLVADSDRTLVFTSTQETARQAADLLRTCGVQAEPMHSDLTAQARQQTMEDFAAGRLQALTSPRILDQGIDVPEADLGIILSASKSRRQMVQRLGRVVRRKADGRCGRLVVLYAEGTVDDPLASDGSNPLTDVLGYADRVETFRMPHEVPELAGFLADRWPSGVTVG